jgi:hypothetical protein
LLFDAEKFYYRGNGNAELVRDTEFFPEKYPDHNVIKKGTAGIESAGFLGNDWAVENGDFVWRE